MPDLNRREMLAAAGVVASVALLADAVHAAQSDAADALSHVAPELRPAARKIVELADSQGPLDDAALPRMRGMGAGFAKARRADIPVEARTVPGVRGQPAAEVYLINSRREAPPRPAILHTHGGGFIVGQAKWEVGYLQDLAAILDCVIVTVEYRLAPETRYTGSIEDNYAGLRWLYTQAPDLGVDRARIAVMGESAGGGHAALLAITARDRGEVPIAFQSLIYPMLDDRTGGSFRLPPFIGAIGWDGPANQFGWRCFLGMVPGSAAVPVAAVPARVADVTGLPPTFIAVGGVDLFVVEDIAYARRLTEGGVPTELLMIPGAFHGFDRVAPETPQARQFTAAKIEALRKAFQPASQPRAQL